MSGIMLNEDCNHFIFLRHKAGIRVDENGLREFIRQYRNTQVTDLLLNPNGMISFGASRVRQQALDKYLHYVATDRVDDSNAYVEVLHDIYVKQGLDMYKIWLDECANCGINGWISVRMNDCHCNEQEDHLLLSDFFKEKKHLRRVVHRDYEGYFDRCPDYSHEEVRTHNLEYIQECLAKYDMYGLELDWMREIFCFGYGREAAGIAIINDFMRQVKEMVTAAESIRKHPIQVAVRLPHSPLVALRLGFDVMTWAQEEWIDMVIPTPRWDVIDLDLPLDFWRKVLPDTQVVGGIEIMLQVPEQSNLNKHISQTLETTAGNAIVNLSRGCDKVYYFNYMDFLPGQEGVNTFYADPGNPVLPENYSIFLNHFGALESLLPFARRHPVTSHDIEPNGTVTLPLWPLRVETFHQLRRVNLGIVPAGKKLTLLLAARAVEAAETTLSEADFSIFVNSAAVRFLGKRSMPETAYGDWPYYAFEVATDGNFPQTALVEIAGPGKKLEIGYLEIRVD